MALIIRQANFVKSATAVEHYPESSLPEILLVGRSNVGKSSFINTVLRRKNLAHISGKPGKTQTLNFYLVNDQFHFVDVPGYGYAKVSKTAREEFATMIDTYLREREQLRLVIQLIDFRHPPTADDKIMLDYMRAYDIPVILVGTKVDKVPKTKRQKQERFIVQQLAIEANQFLPFSATEQINLDVVYDLLDQVVEESK